jgi:hypothetical protein
VNGHEESERCLSMKTTDGPGKSLQEDLKVRNVNTHVRFVHSAVPPFFSFSPIRKPTT